MSPAALADRLDSAPPQIAACSVVVGFDAFVDEIIHVVGTRTAPEAYVPVPTIGEFGQWVVGSAGRSGLREFVSLERAAGGCAINTADGLATLGFPLDLFAGTGMPPDSVFAPLFARCRSHDALGLEPGRAIIYEFQDGKLMFCSFSHFAEVTPEFLARSMACGTYRRACAEAAGIVLTSWSVYPHMTACWKFLQQHALRGLPNRPRIFLDLADPASRDPGDLVGMMEALGGFEAIGSVTLSLNGNEANRIARAMRLAEAAEDPRSVERLARELRQAAGISQVGIHLIKFATSATADGSCTVAGPYCPAPKKSVGAGDRFNAGWLAGILLDLEPAGQLLLAAAVSGFFVRHARSPTPEETIRFLRELPPDNIEMSSQS